MLFRSDVPHHEGFTADYVGFRVPNQFVVGYGLDYRELYRNLPFICTLRSSVYELDAAAATNSSRPEVDK